MAEPEKDEHWVRVEAEAEAETEGQALGLSRAHWGDRQVDKKNEREARKPPDAHIRLS